MRLAAPSAACSSRGLAAGAAAAPRPRPPQRPAAARRRGPPPAGAASVELDFDALSSVDIESISYDAGDGLYTVQGCLLSPAAPDHVYQVLTDYEALPRVFHNIETSQVRRCADTGCKQLVQTCKWAFLVFSGTFVTELSVEEDPAARQLTFSLIESAFMREFVGSWDVRPGGGGSALTEVRHRLSVRPSLAPPQKIGDITKKVFKKQVEGILADLALELQRTAPAAQRPGSG